MLKRPFKLAIINGWEGCCTNSPWSLTSNFWIFPPESWLIKRPNVSANCKWGLRLSMISGLKPGIFTAVRAESPKRTSLICSATSTATFSWASLVDAPKWGVRIKFLSTLSSGEFECNGSSEKTSIAAPPITELLSAMTDLFFMFSGSEHVSLRLWFRSSHLNVHILAIPFRWRAYFG